MIVNQTGTELVLVRHGQSEGNVKQFWEGAGSDSPLTALGRQQAEATGDHLSGSMSGATIYTSPLARTRETAERIATHIRGQVVTMTELIEIDWGDLEGLTTQQIGERFPRVLAQFGKNFTSPVPGGDVAADVGKRWAKAVEWIVGKESERGKAVVVSHQGAISMGLMHLMDNVEGFADYQLPNCAILRIRFNPNPEIEGRAWIGHLTSRGVESTKWVF